MPISLIECHNKLTIHKVSKSPAEGYFRKHVFDTEMFRVHVCVIFYSSLFVSMKTCDKGITKHNVHVYLNEVIYLSKISLRNEFCTIIF